MTDPAWLSVKVDGKDNGIRSFSRVGNPRGGVVLRSTKLTARLYLTVVKIEAGPMGKKYLIPLTLKPNSPRHFLFYPRQRRFTETRASEHSAGLGYAVLCICACFF